MARPQRKGLLYFPMDVDFFQSSELRLLFIRHHSKGVHLYLKILCDIYEKGYYLEVTSDYIELCCIEMSIQKDDFDKMLRYYLSRNFFDNDTYFLNKALTSREIQLQYCESVKEKAKKTPIYVYDNWLLKQDDTNAQVYLSWKNEQIKEKKNKVNNK